MRAYFPSPAPCLWPPPSPRAGLGFPIPGSSLQEASPKQHQEGEWGLSGGFLQSFKQGKRVQGRELPPRFLGLKPHGIAPLSTSPLWSIWEPGAPLFWQPGPKCPTRSFGKGEFYPERAEPRKGYVTGTGGRGRKKALAREPLTCCSAALNRVFLVCISSQAGI